MARDFRSTQIETTKIILSGGVGPRGIGGIIYSGSVATNRSGGIPVSMLSDVGTDVFLFVSGTVSPSKTDVTLFGGDVVISGTLYGGGIISGDSDWVDRGNAIVTTSSVSIAGGLGDTFLAANADSRAYVFVSGTRREIATIRDGSTGLLAASPDVAFFGGDAVFSGSIYGRSPLSSGPNYGLDLDSQFVTIRGGSQIAMANSDAIAPGTGPSLATDVFFSVSGSINSKDSVTNGTAVFGGDIVMSGNVYTFAGVHRSIATKTTNFTVAFSDHFLFVDSSAGHVTASLQTAANAGAGREIIIKDVAGYAGTNNIVIKPQPGDKLEGIADETKITATSGSLQIISDGVSNYYIYGVRD